MGSFFAKPAPVVPLVRTNKYTTNASGAPMPYIRIPPPSPPSSPTSSPTPSPTPITSPRGGSRKTRKSL